MQMNIWKVFVVASILAYTPANARHFGHRAVNGVCGSADGVSTTSAPTTNLCSAGTATAVSDIGSWTWSCVGRNGGSTASCSATISSSGSGSGSGSGTGSSSGSGSSASAQVPGPNASLFNSPYYQCKANYYVSNSGSDSNNGSQSAPWATLQHADSANVGAGSCINVAPGTYDGVQITHGGNTATATGYVVYRCQTLDGCTINGNAGVNGSAAFETVQSDTGTPPNYIQIDGFQLVGTANANYAAGVNIYNGDGSAKAASHHIWVLNSVITGFTQSGIQTGGSDYDYFLHNTLTGNAHSNGASCNAQGSAISVFQASEIAGYTPTADDQSNPVFGSWQINGSFFHVVIEYNVAYNNAITTCGTVSNPWDTDGEGIILDTNAASAGNPTNYTHPMLAAYNIVYNNGGGGVHVLGTANAVVANNSCYNNWIDPANNGSFKGCIDSSYGVGGSYGGTYINNIAVAIPAASSDCSISPPYIKFNDAIVADNDPNHPVDTFSNNITDMIGVGCVPEVDLESTDTYTSPPNFENTNPMWVNVGTTSVGTETTPPVGANFALSPGSPAIGKGLTEPYLPQSSVDLGACASSLAVCP